MFSFFFFLLVASLHPLNIAKVGKRSIYRHFYIHVIEHTIFVINQ